MNEIQSAEEFARAIGHCVSGSMRVADVAKLIEADRAAQRQAGREEAEKMGVIILRDMDNFYATVVDAAKKHRDEVCSDCKKADPDETCDRCTLANLGKALCDLGEDKGATPCRRLNR